MSLGQFAALVMIAPAWVGTVAVAHAIRTGSFEPDPLWSVWPEALLLAVVGIPPFLLMIMREVMINSPDMGGRPMTIAAYVAAVSIAPLLTPLLLFGAAIGLAELFIRFILVPCCNALARKLGERPWLGAAMTTAGLILFTAGNTLQFSATFDG